MTILVLIEHSGGTPEPASLGVLGAAKVAAAQMGSEVVCLVAGSGVTDLAGSLGAWGASRVLCADDARFSSPTAGALTDALDAAITASGARYVVSGASVLAAEVLGGVAARRGVGIITDAVAMAGADGALTITRPALDDSEYVTCGFRGAGDGCVGTALFRAGSFAVAPANGGQASVEALSVPMSGRRAVEHLGIEQASTGGVDITQADVLVGAGRGLGGPEHMGIVEQLAGALGGEVATTRAVVDAGWYDYSTQVGQTGKTVTPKLYVAVGISGAIQHKVGMQNAGTIIAINKDPNAPIFEYSDLGVVGDLFDVVPKLEGALRAKRGS